MSSMDDLVAAIRAAIATPEQPCTIEVPNDAQKGLGESALGRMAPGADHITFTVNTSVGRSAVLMPAGSSTSTMDPPLRRYTDGYDVGHGTPGP